MLVLTAHFGGVSSGYLIAYDRDHDGSFYLWMAGVKKDFRRHQLMTELMDYEDKWLLENGFTSLKVKTRNDKRAMILNLIKRGFNATLVEPGKSVESNIIHLVKDIK
jgi:ribosomal protein S18 acetylase RimI-like enzyme